MIPNKTFINDDMDVIVHDRKRLLGNNLDNLVALVRETTLLEAASRFEQVQPGHVHWEWLRRMAAENKS